MGVVKEGKQEADNHCIQTTLFKQLSSGAHFILGHWRFNLACWRGKPFSYWNTIAPLDQRLALPRYIKLQREIMRAFVTRHVHDVAETSRGQHADVGTVAFNHHVGCDSCAVKQHVNVAGAHTGLLADLQDTGNHPF